MIHSNMSRLRKALQLAALAVCALAAVATHEAQAQAPAKAPAKAAPATPAPSATSIAAAKEILALKEAGQIYQDAVVNLIANTRGALLQQHLDKQKDIEELSVTIAAQMKGRESEVADEMAKLYASNFTEAEMRDLLAFYKSPLGRKAIVNEPKALQESVDFIDQWAVKITEEIAGRYRDEMKKRGKPL